MGRHCPGKIIQLLRFFKAIYQYQGPAEFESNVLGLVVYRESELGLSFCSQVVELSRAKISELSGRIPREGRC